MLRESENDILYFLQNKTQQLETRMESAEALLHELQQQIVNGIKMQELSEAKRMVSIFAHLPSWQGCKSLLFKVVLNQMQDNISNVSSMAMSAEIEGNNNKIEISKLLELFHNEMNRDKTYLNDWRYFKRHQKKGSQPWNYLAIQK